MTSMRFAKIILLLLVALQGMILGFSNCMSFDGVVGEVTRTLSMEATWKIPQHMWRATDNSLMIIGASLFIVAMELAMTFLCGLGAFKLWRVRAQDKASFNAAKRTGLLGCFFGIVLFYGSFTIVAGNFYEIWQGLARPVLDTAFRHGAFILLVMLFVAETNQD